MYEALVTITGNLVGEAVEHTTPSGLAYTTLRVCSTSRRYDRASGSMVRGDTLTLQVRCWRGLARAVAALGDGTPVVVHGRLVTRDGSTHLNATAIGVDLARAPLPVPIGSAA